MLILLLTLTLGVVDAGNLLYEVQQQEQLPPADGYLCPDQASKCPYTSTCCQLSSGQWGCCPFDRATCCGDNIHCCPNGYMCNKDKEQCVRAINNDTMPWATKEEAVAAVGEPSSSEETISGGNKLVCERGGGSCSNKASCCRTPSGAYRCCNYPNNVCCSGGNSCCPRCTVCDQVNNKCIKGFESEKWELVSASTPAFLPSESTPAAEKMPANVIGASGEEKTTQSPLNKVWCDPRTYCANGRTCCRRPNGSWGCCPYGFANCCYGGTYCCPRGKKCSFPAGRCY